jgi:hypothetical protein
MTRKNVLTVVFFAAVISCLIALPRGAIGAEQVNFALTVGQSVTVKNYGLRFRGLTAGLPSYELFQLGGAPVRLPQNSQSANPQIYVYGNVSVVTSAVSPDGKQVTGSVTVE